MTYDTILRKDLSNPTPNKLCGEDSLNSVPDPDQGFLSIQTRIKNAKYFLLDLSIRIFNPPFRIIASTCRSSFLFMSRVHPYVARNRLFRQINTQKGASNDVIIRKQIWQWKNDALRVWDSKSATAGYLSIWEAVDGGKIQWGKKICEPIKRFRKEWQTVRIK